MRDKHAILHDIIRLVARRAAEYAHEALVMSGTVDEDAIAQRVANEFEPQPSECLTS